MTRTETIFDVVGRGAVHPFPARMAPGIALSAISSSSRRLRILDPMMGSGTVLAVARAHGHRAIGADLDPLAVLITRVWTTPTDREEVTRTALNVLNAAKNQFKRLTASKAYPKGATEETKKFARYWFDPYARRQLTALACKISAVKKDEIRNVLWCAFSRLIITKQAGASRAMDLSHSRPHRVFARAPSKPFRHFIKMVDRVLECTISNNFKSRGPKVSVYQADARRLPIRSKSIDLVITSPPYLNAIDYIRCSKFTLIWMGYSVQKLRALRATSVGTEAGISERQADVKIKEILEEIDPKSRLSSRNRSILVRYIFDMKTAMREASRTLSSKGRLIYVVGENTLRGTYIRTSRILAAIAAQIGLQLVDRSSRILPRNRRYLPPPRSAGLGTIDVRMRREVIISFRKKI